MFIYVNRFTAIAVFDYTILRRYYYQSNNDTRTIDMNKTKNIDK